MWVALAPFRVAVEFCKAGLRDKALRHQCLVVVKLFLRNVDLRHSRIGLLFGLALAGLKLGRVDARNHLAGLYFVALAHHQVHQLASHTRFDHRHLAGL